MRNRSKNGGYIEKDYVKRAIDDPNGVSRLNKEMVSEFYNALPSKNKGQFIHISGIPHGIERDGNVIENYKKYADLLYMILSS